MIKGDEALARRLCGLLMTDVMQAAPALLDDVPGFHREDLSVCSAPEWEQRNAEPILETWLAKARAP